MNSYIYHPQIKLPMLTTRWSSKFRDLAAFTENYHFLKWNKIVFSSLKPYI